ncbi:hypothetical protein V1506DRAFT_542853 [Lipomyces tetrasporus]
MDNVVSQKKKVQGKGFLYLESRIVCTGKIIGLFIGWKVLLLRQGYISAGALLDLGTHFAFYPLTITSILLSEWRTVYESFADTIKYMRNPVRSNYAKFHDVHSRMRGTRRYLIGGSCPYLSVDWSHYSRYYCLPDPDVGSWHPYRDGDQFHSFDSYIAVPIGHRLWLWYRNDDRQ